MSWSLQPYIKYYLSFIQFQSFRIEQKLNFLEWLLFNLENMPKCWIGDSRINHEKIIIKKKNTTSPNVKEKLKKDGEKEKQERER